VHRIGFYFRRRWSEWQGHSRTHSVTSSCKKLSLYLSVKGFLHESRWVNWVWACRRVSADCRIVWEGENVVDCRLTEWRAQKHLLYDNQRTRGIDSLTRALERLTGKFTQWLEKTSFGLKTIRNSTTVTWTNDSSTVSMSFASVYGLSDWFRTESLIRNVHW
jgi:hypothetical protein